MVVATLGSVALDIVSIWVWILLLLQKFYLGEEGRWIESDRKKNQVALKGKCLRK